MGGDRVTASSEASRSLSPSRALLATCGGVARACGGCEPRAAVRVRRGRARGVAVLHEGGAFTWRADKSSFWLFAFLPSRRPITIPSSDLIGALHTPGEASFAPYCARRGALAPLTAASPSVAASLVAALRSTAAPWTDDDGLPRPRAAAVAVNPASGRGRGVALAHRFLVPALKAAGVEPRLTITSGPDDVTAVAATADTATTGALIAVGGDGTAKLLLEGLMARADAATAAPRLPLALLPAGSGNALSVAMACGVCPRAAAGAIARGRAIALDVLAVDGGAADSTNPAAPRPRRTAAFLSLTYGLIANADVGTEAWRWMGPARFVVGALREVIARRAHPVEVWCVPVGEGGEGGAASPPTRPEAATPRVALPPAGGAVGAPPPPPPPPPPALAHALLDALPAAAFATLPPAGGPRPPVLDLPAPWARLPTETVSLFAACNLPHLDASTRMAPAARPACGALHAVWARGGVPVGAALKIMLGVESGKHVDSPHVATQACSALLLRPLDAPANTVAVVDGERGPGGGAGVVAVGVLPGAARLLVREEDE